MLVVRPQPLPPSQEDLEQGIGRGDPSSESLLVPGPNQAPALPQEVLTTVIEVDSGSLLLPVHKYRSSSGEVLLSVAPGETRARIEQGGGLHLLVADSRLFMVDALTGAARNITPDQMPDLDLDRQALRRLGPARGIHEPLVWAEQPLISRDGQRIAYLSNRRWFREAVATGSRANHQMDLWIYEVGSGVHHLAATDVAQPIMYWVSNYQLAYTSEEMHQSHTYRMHVYDVNSHRSELIRAGLSPVIAAGAPGFAVLDLGDATRDRLSLFGWDGSLRGTFAQQSISTTAFFSSSGKLCLTAMPAHSRDGRHLYILDQNLQPLVETGPPTGHLILQLRGWWGNRCVVTTAPIGSTTETTWAVEVREP